jgi:hypothetical protein
LFRTDSAYRRCGQKTNRDAAMFNDLVRWGEALKAARRKMDAGSFAV